MSLEVSQFAQFNVCVVVCTGTFQRPDAIVSNILSQVMPQQHLSQLATPNMVRIVRSNVLMHLSITRRLDDKVNEPSGLNFHGRNRWGSSNVEYHACHYVRGAWAHTRTCSIRNSRHDIQR